AQQGRDARACGLRGTGGDGPVPRLLVVSRQLLDSLHGGGRATHSVVPNHAPGEGHRGGGGPGGPPLPLCG
ncbi:unnamed protein product, partial [Ectocarpus sp. 12 AP-2014]